MTIPEGHPYEATQALRQVLNRAVAWEVLDSNPAKRGVPNPLRRSLEKRPFDSWQQVEAVAVHLGPVYGPMVVFAAATGLRPAELFALEHRDLDFRDGLVYVRRAYANGRVKHVKTRRSMRGVPLQGMALEALRRLPPNPTTPLVFPNARGGYIDLHNFRQRHWRPALSAAGIEPLRQPYDLRDPTLGWPSLPWRPLAEGHARHAARNMGSLPHSAVAASSSAMRTSAIRTGVRCASTTINESRGPAPNLAAM
jgi:hypothetical protein